MEVSSGPGHSCDLRLAGVREGDSGYYMCMLTQADTYHTRSVWVPIPNRAGNQYPRST